MDHKKTVHLMKLTCWMATEGIRYNLTENKAVAIGMI